MVTWEVSPPELKTGFAMIEKLVALAVKENDSLSSTKLSLMMGILNDLTVPPGEVAGNVSVTFCEV